MRASCRCAPTKNALGWDMTFATNHLGPFALTEALVPHLPDGANVVFVASAVEDPERKPAKAVGFRGARYISAEASARGEWKPGGSKMPGADAYATSKQCNLRHSDGRSPVKHHGCASTRSSRALIPTTGLGRRCQRLRALLVEIHHSAAVPLLMPFMKFLSTPEASRARDHQNPDRCIRSDRRLLRRGRPSDARLRACARPEFQDRVVAETRALLATVPK